MTGIRKTPAAAGSAPFAASDAASGTAIPASPPPEVLEALDRAARVLSELGRSNISVALEPRGGNRIWVMLRHPGSPAGEEISHHSLLDLLDGDTSEVGELTSRLRSFSPSRLKPGASAWQPRPPAPERETMANGYEALLLLTRIEQELVDAGRFDELESLGEDWQAVVAGLEDPSPADRALLKEIELTVWTTVAAVRLRYEEIAHLLTLLERGRRAIGADGGPSRRRASSTHAGDA